MKKSLSLWLGRSSTSVPFIILLWEYVQFMVVWDGELYVLKESQEKDN
jgi:hypothetical protein